MQQQQINSRHLSTTVLRCMVVLVAISLASSAVQAQTRRGPPTHHDPVELGRRDARELFDEFRQTHIASPFSFLIELVYLPRIGDSRELEGVLIGAPTDNGPALRVFLAEYASPRQTQETGDVTRHELLMRPSFEGSGRLVENLDTAPRLAFQPLAADAWNEPMIEGIPLRPFDLFSLFLGWDNYTYQGSDRVSGRPSHVYLVYPPEEDKRFAAIGAVRLVIDEDFAALLNLEILDETGDVLRELRVRRFKKYDEGRWLAREFDLYDRQSRARVRITVKAVALDLVVASTLFEPGPSPSIANLAGQIQYKVF